MQTGGQNKTALNKVFWLKKHKALKFLSPPRPKEKIKTSKKISHKGPICLEIGVFGHNSGW